MCNLYAHRATRDRLKAGLVPPFDEFDDHGSNFPPLFGIYPDYQAPIIRLKPGTRTAEMAMARWGMPSPKQALEGKKTDPGVTNVCNAKSGHWRRWLGVENRCLVPFTSFSEPEPQPDGCRPPAWFAFHESRPLAFFAGIWILQWKSVRKVGAIHPKAMPVIPTLPEELNAWLTAPVDEALRLQRPLPDGALTIARGMKDDNPDLPADTPLLI